MLNRNSKRPRAYSSPNVWRRRRVRRALRDVAPAIAGMATAAYAYSDSCRQAVEVFTNGLAPVFARLVIEESLAECAGVVTA